METLQRLAIELLHTQHTVFADLVNGEFIQIHNRQDDLGGAPTPPPQNDQPEWCKCGPCRVMPTEIENKCCTRSVRPCITSTPLFQQLVLDANVLDIAMRYREDVLVVEHPRNNENFRHSACRQCVLWQHGRLGQGNRRVVPVAVLMPFAHVIHFLMVSIEGVNPLGYSQIISFKLLITEICAG